MSSIDLQLATSRGFARNGGGMSKHARQRAKRKSKRARPKPVELSSQPWSARAAKSIGITARDQPRRAATGPNGLPP